MFPNDLSRLYILMNIVRGALHSYGMHEGACKIKYHMTKEDGFACHVKQWKKPFDIVHEGNAYL